MPSHKYPPISVHNTLEGKIEVNWKLDYHQEFNCPNCKNSNLTWFSRKKESHHKLQLQCKLCRKSVCLSCRILGSGYNHYPISQHQTEHGILKVNWKLKYRGEYNCPHCKENKIDRYKKHKNSTCELHLYCKFCKKHTNLTCPLPVHISRYYPEMKCPNTLCTGIGHNGQRGWIYKISGDYCKCYFCKIKFKQGSTIPYSWVGSNTERKLSTFSFKDDIWDLINFYENPYCKTLNFGTINPVWYREEVKKYIHYLLKTKRFSSEGRVVDKVTTYRQFGRVITNLELKSKNQIERNTITLFLDSCKSNANSTINSKLTALRDFFDWTDLGTKSLVRSRDFLKKSKNDPDWLDKVVREAIKQHLNKIPAPIARHYLIQAYIAARSGDVCQLSRDCLIEKNGKWYIDFFQGKVKRPHRILVNRKIRKLIEEQQKWIEDVLGKNYSYLFCHFRAIKKASYPAFKNMKPLPKPSSAKAANNPMIRIIRILIEKENILDANGQKPNFTGKITRPSRIQEIRAKYGMEAAQLYADHKSSETTFQHYAPPSREQIAEVDLPFQELLLNPDNRFLPWQSLPESLLQNPTAHELDLEMAPRLVVYGHCALDPKIPCPVNLFPKCYGCSSFRPSTGKLPLYERQYQGEQQRLTEAEKAGAELASEEAKATIEAMDKWLPELRRLANG